METIRAYTTIEQSKVLAEILPHGSADMVYCAIHNIGQEVHHCNVPIFAYASNKDIPCWSLAALFSALPFHLIVNNQRYAFSMIKGFNKNGETYAIKYYAIFNSAFYYHMTDFYNSPIDAAFEMVCWLKENEKL